MRSLRRVRRPWQSGSGTVSSLLPLVIFSLLAAVFMTQSGATLADSSFQSPVSPVQTPAPAATPTQVEVAPPEELPVVPPAESPVVPAVESPVVPPAEELGETPGATTGPQVTPSAGAPGEVATAELPSGEERPAPGGEDSLAVLIDALVVGFSSVWLCCGGLALVVFVLLMIASLVLRVT